MTLAYRTGAAFRQALEQRLRTVSASGVDFARRRQLVVFDRFLARVALELGDAVTLKGGLAVELRIERARTTKDVDLRVMGSPDDILDRLRSAAGRDLADFMVFTIRPDDRHPEIQNDGMQHEGLRFRAECAVAGKVYGRPFAGIAPPRLRVYPVETHVAEKLHAYTMPRARPNSRVKDLPDIALIATAGRVEATRVRAAVAQTFAFRGTHEVPQRLPAPPENWAAPYAVMAREDQLRWSTLVDAFEAARAFLDPVLTGSDGAVWDPFSWRWTVPARPPNPD